MLEILEFVLGSFWRFIGFIMILGLVSQVVIAMWQVFWIYMTGRIETNRLFKKLKKDD